MQTKKKILIIVYGDVYFDGRAKRLIEISQEIGEVRVIDAASEKKSTPTINGHYRIQINNKWPNWRKHLFFWIGSIRHSITWKPDLTIGLNFFTTLPAWVCSKLSSSKLVYDAYELIIPENNYKMTKRDFFWYQLERFTANKVDIIIAANPERAQLMHEHYKRIKSITYMRNIPAEKVVTSDQISKIYSQHPSLIRRNNADKIIIYQGDISISRGIDKFVAALEFMPNNFRIVVAGSGPDLELLISLANPYSISDRFSAVGRIPHEMLPALTRCCDVGIVTYPYHGNNNIYCAPNKIFEYAQAGLPVLATDQPPLKSLVTQYQIGILVGTNDTPKSIAEKFVQLINDIDEYKSKIPEFVKKHQWNTELDRVKTKIENVLFD